MSPAEAGSAVAPHGVDFIDEDDAGGVLLSLDEQVPNPGGPHADEHLHEIGTADGKEGNVGFPRYGPGQKGLARSRRADQKNPLGNPPAQAGEFLGVPQELDDLLQLFLGLFDPGHVLEGYLRLPLGKEFYLGLAERHGFGSPGLHLAHEEDPEADEEKHGKPGDQHGHVPGRVILGLGRDLHVLFFQGFDQIRVGRGKGSKFFEIAVPSVKVVPLDGDFPHFPPFQGDQKVAEDDLFLGRPGLIEEVEKEDHHQTDDQPQGQILIKRAQFSPPHGYPLQKPFKLGFKRLPT